MQGPGHNPQTLHEMNNNTHTYEEIARLLDLYYTGQSTLADEQTLREYLASTDADPAFTADKRMFGAINAPVAAPEQLKQGFYKELDRKEASGRFRKRINPFWQRVAAAVVITFAVGTTTYLSAPHTPDAPMPTELTADEAHATTQRALNLLCQVMAKGETAIAKSDSTTTHAIEQTMRKLNKLQ